MKILVAVVGLFIGYILNNYILTVNEDEKGEVFKCNFEKNKTTNVGYWEYSIERNRFETVIGGIICPPAGEHVLLELYKAKEGEDYLDLYQLLAYDIVTEIIESEHDWLKKIYKDEERKETDSSTGWYPVTSRPLQCIAFESSVC